MKTILLLSLSIFVFAFTNHQPPMNTSPTSPLTVSSFHDFEIAGLMDGQIKMSDFEGKYILCVNVASKCGYTPQYAPLQELFDQYQDKLVVIGFPCNQFMRQEPGSAEDIAAFCERNYGVSFPMTEKIDVKGKEQHPIYAWLTQKAQNNVSDAKVSWNFNKFLISPEGQWLAHFPSGTDPLSDEIVGYLK